MTDKVAVTQADRDAAADYERFMLNDENSYIRAIRAGKHDSHPLIQAFASHRLASTDPLMGEVREDDLAELIETRLLGVPLEEQDLALEDDDWREIIAALRRRTCGIGDNLFMALEAAFGPILKEAFPEYSSIERMHVCCTLAEAVKVRQDWFSANGPASAAENKAGGLWYRRWHAAQTEIMSLRALLAKIEEPKG